MTEEQPAPLNKNVQEVTGAPLDKDHFLKIASEGRAPNNREMLLASLPEEIRNRLDSTHPTYQRNYDIWQAQLDAFLKEEHPVLQGGGRENLAREIYQTLRSFGLDLTDRNLPLDKLIKEFLNSRNLRPVKDIRSDILAKVLSEEPLPPEEPPLESSLEPTLEQEELIDIPWDKLELILHKTRQIEEKKISPSIPAVEAETAQPAKEEPTAVKEAEQPKIPVLNQLWELEYGGETYGRNARLLGDSYDAKVYQPEDNPGVVVKEYKPRSHAVFEAEKDAFLKLQGSKHIVELLGIGENPIDPYLVKRFFNGENLYQTFLEANSFPLRSGEAVSPEQRKLAAWFVSSMEALAEFYEEGVTVTDFKLDDWLWDPKEGRTVLIDLGNAQTVEKLGKEYGGTEAALKTEHLRDINNILKLFLKSTELGMKKGMTFDQFGIVHKWPDNQDYLSVEQGQQLVQEIVNSGGSNSLATIILAHAGAVWNQETAATAQAYIPALKTYFTEVGLY